MSRMTLAFRPPVLTKAWLAEVLRYSLVIAATSPVRKRITAPMTTQTAVCVGVASKTNGPMITAKASNTNKKNIAIAFAPFLAWPHCLRAGTRGSTRC